MALPVTKTTFENLAIGDFFYFDIDQTTQQVPQGWEDPGLMVKVSEVYAVPVEEGRLISPKTKVMKLEEGK